MSALELVDAEREAVIEVREEFRINTPERAEWLLRKLANIDAERRRVKAQAETILKRLETEEESLRKRFSFDLEMLCRGILDKQGNKRKSVDFLQARCSFRDVAASYKITNEKDALDYAKVTHIENAIKTVEQLDKEVFRQYAESQMESLGVLVPGVDYEGKREAFSIRLNKTKDEED